MSVDGLGKVFEQVAQTVKGLLAQSICAEERSMKMTQPEGLVEVQRAEAPMPTLACCRDMPRGFLTELSNLGRMRRPSCMMFSRLMSAVNCSPLPFFELVVEPWPLSLSLYPFAASS